MKSQTHTRTRVALAALVGTILVAALAFSSRGVSSQSGTGPQRRDLDGIFSRHDRLTLDPGKILRQVKQTNSLTLSTSRGTFELTLTPHDMRAPGYRAEAWSDKGVHVIETGPVRTYKGTVRGLPTAQARLTIDEETVEGLIITREELFFLEPTKRFSGTAAKTDFVFYSESDLKVPLGECGTTTAQMVAQHSASGSNQESATGPQPEAIFGPAQEIGISLEADFEWFNQFGVESAAVANVEGVINQVEGIYNTQMGLEFNILHTRVWTTDTDPYTSSVPSTLLNQFRTSYNSSAPAPAATRDIAHLFTGRDLDGSTIGIAFLPGLECPFNPQGTGSFGYGLSQFNGFNQTGLTAHEIGHNLNAVHVTTAQGNDCTTSVMNPSITASTNFCQFSRDQITEHTIATRNCLTPLTQPGCTYSLSATAQNIPASGGPETVFVTTSGGCNWGVAEGLSWLSVTSGASGSGSGPVTYSATANSVCGPRTGLVSIGGQILTVTQAGKPDYLTDPNTATAIALGQTSNGNLSTADCTYGLVGSSGADQRNAFMDRYKFFGMAGQKIRIDMTAGASGLDTFLYLYGPDGTVVDSNDDIVPGVQTDSRIPCAASGCGLELRTLPQTGTYIIIATSFASGDTGAYSLTLTSAPLLLTAQVTDSVGSAAAVNSVTFVRTSNPNSNPPNTAFRIFDPFNFSADKTTRLILFTSDLGLAQQNPNPSVVSVTAGGRQLVVENVGPFAFPGLSGSYIIVSLGQLNVSPVLTGNLAFTVTRSGLTSNVATITIEP